MLKIAHSPGALVGTDVGIRRPSVLNGVTHVSDERIRGQQVGYH